MTQPPLKLPVRKRLPDCSQYHSSLPTIRGEATKSPPPRRYPTLPISAMFTTEEGGTFWRQLPGRHQNRFFPYPDEQAGYW